MGKYQLDYKGMQRVEKFHEKHSTVKDDKKARVQALLKKPRARRNKSETKIDSSQPSVFD